METFKLRIFALVPFHLFFFFTLFTCNLPATLQDNRDVCKLVFCGKGTCQSNNELLGFNCECDSGWKKFNIGTFEFPPCVIPNCTFDARCGNGSLLAPPPLPPLLNFSDPCLLNLCGDGTCVRDGSGFRCQCNEGSANLLKDPKMTCFKKSATGNWDTTFCFQKGALGADCNGLGPDFQTSTPPTESSGTPKTGNSGSPQTGLGEMLNQSRELHLLTTMMIFAAIFLNWI